MALGMTGQPSPQTTAGDDSASSFDTLYAPPSSRPAEGGVVRPTGNPWWRGYGVGWVAIGFTFLWLTVALPLLARFSSVRFAAAAGLLWLGMLVAPTLAVGAYFGLRRQWKSLLGVLLAWLTAIVFGVLLVAVLGGIAGSR
ncbi:hypothetical protein [Lysobacter solisilvae (ex Woo and Kim 2020)]|uniref:Uncharacterized protein n=1 Tax=Agrilutibacter terrestris TaxID=2865112 RepID=A0A7H0FXX8_9GAMM|nr:hypothetical protein [Lysobacter terrestris]QNP40894.1 hypothetical protein H8B22_01145 [Lysobacter terrestris]